MRSRLGMLGGVSLTGPDGPVTGRAAQRRRLAVLAILAVAPAGSVSRDRIVALLWPETSQDKARHLLSDAIYALRKALGKGAIESLGDEELRLESDVVATDVADFERALEAGDLEGAVSAYGGEFLDGFHVSDAREFERWVEEERQRLRALYGEVLEELARTAEQADEPTAGVRWWRKRVAQDPLDSRVVRCLMDALVAAGSPAGAVSRATAHARLVREELGVDPGEEVLELLDRLRRDDSDRTDTTMDVAVARATHPQPTRTVAASRDGGASSYWRPEWFLAATGMLLAIVFGWVVVHTNRPATPPLRLVISDFGHAPQDSVLAATVTEAVRIDLARSPRAALASPPFVRAVLEQMRRSPDTSLTARLAREVALRGDLDGFVSGAIRPVGEGFVLMGRVSAAVDGRELVTARAFAPDSSAIVVALDSLAKELRRGLGEPLEGVRTAASLARVTTSSLVALQRYSQAHRLMHGGGRFETVRRLFEDALAADSTFALAYRSLSEYLGWWVRDTGARDSLAREAYRYRAGLPDGERLYVEGWYHQVVTGDRAKAIAAYEAMLTALPGSSHLSVLDHLGTLHRRQGDLRTSRAYHERRLRLDSLSSSLPYSNLAITQMKMGDYAAAVDVVEAMERVFGKDVASDALRLRGFIANGRRDYERSLQIANTMLTEAEDAYGRYFAARYLTYVRAVTGRIPEAEAATTRAVHWAREVERPVQMVAAQLAMATFELFAVHDTAGALARVERALGAVPLDSVHPVSRDYAWVAEIYAGAGRPEIARRLLQEEASVRRGGVSAREKRTVAWAAIDLAEGRAANALDRLRPLLRDKPSDRGCVHVWGCEVHLAARAYELQGRADSARAMYRRFVEAPFNQLFYDAWFRAHALERLAVLQERAGKPRVAARTWELLAQLWSGCDPRLRPRVRQAQVRSRGLMPLIYGSAGQR